MFERRLKIVLLMLSCFIAALTLRAASVQLLNRDHWKKEASAAMTRARLVDTSRGRILDVKGRVLAEDRPCIDACVEYRALTIEPDSKWVWAVARKRLESQLDDRYKNARGSKRAEMLNFEAERVRADIRAMWPELARLSSRGIEDIQTTRDLIVQRVDNQRLSAFVHEVERSHHKLPDVPTNQAAWKKWMVDSNGESDLDKLRVTVAEQLEPHPILPAIDNDLQNELGKRIDQFPGLTLRPGAHRYYPYGDVAAHLLGQLGHAGADELQRQAKSEKEELRQYLPNDLVGKSGVEAMCEHILRGARGKIQTVVGDTQVTTLSDPVKGDDVQLSIDIDLQQKIQGAFADATIRDGHGVITEQGAVLHGAAVVIDVKSGEVRALVSYPTYDANTFDEQYNQLREDTLNTPLLNRATMSQLEPGSTVKPMVGLAAITDGILKVDEGIECTGYLMLDGRRQPGGARCWVASTKSIFIRLGGEVAHHPVPVKHPTGFLTYTDGLERSCNIVFETIEDRLGVERLSEWYDKFGLGRRTGIGIAEARGRIPTMLPLPKTRRRLIGWYAGIGQGSVAATPLQMANVAATIARGGIWQRPTLLAHREDGTVPTTRPADADDSPDRVDLHLSPEGLAAARLGMTRVVSSPAGTGTQLVIGDPMLQSLDIAGKTGSAQAHRLRYQGVDLEPSTIQKPNLTAPWYRAYGGEGTDIAHAWYIGFAPASDPRIAFAVMVEYGGGGGSVAGSVARELLEGCVEHGYLHPPSSTLLTVAPPEPTTQPAEEIIPEER